MSDCLCDWPRHCNGSGVMDCQGCGGDTCVCTCGGEMGCPGCCYCLDRDEYDDDYPDEDEEDG